MERVMVRSSLLTRSKRGQKSQADACQAQSYRREHTLTGSRGRSRVLKGQSVVTGIWLGLEGRIAVLHGVNCLVALLGSLVESIGISLCSW